GRSPATRPRCRRRPPIPPPVRARPCRGATAMARTQREKRMLMALGAVVAVAALLVGLTMIFANGSSKPGSHPVAAGPRPAAKPVVPVLKPLPTASPPPLVFNAVDPFKPLVNTKPASGTNNPAPAPTTQATPAGPSSAVVGGKTVTLLDIYKVK